MRTLPTAFLAAVLAGVLSTLAAGCTPVSSPNPSMPPIGALLDRIGRPLVGTALIVPFGTSEEHAAATIRWKTGTEAERSSMLLSSLPLMDALDGICGNQIAAGSAGPDRYRPLADLLLDDRLLIETRATSCKLLLPVETGTAGDCGGLTPEFDEPDAMLSLLVSGSPTGVTDGVDGDADGAAPVTTFPFLRAPSL